MNVHITGDRSLSGSYIALVSIEMMKAMKNGDTISTGDTGRGVDAIVVDFAQRVGLDILVTGSADADSTSADLADTHVVFIHTDPHVSSRFASFASLPDSALSIVTTSDLAV